MVKCLPEYEYFTVFLKNRNFISNIRSKVKDYAALVSAHNINMYLNWDNCAKLF